MRDAGTLVMHLTGWATEELAAQHRTLAALERQEKAVLARDREALERATRAMAELLEERPRRSARREVLLAELAAAWGVAKRSLTLRSIAERHGAGARRLGELRTELRDGVAKVARRNRRLAALIGLHRRLGYEVLEGLFTGGHGHPLNERGTLVDAEA